MLNLLDILLGVSAIHPQTICTLVAYLAAYLYYAYLQQHSVDTLSLDQKRTLFLAGILGTTIGARLPGIIQNLYFAAHHHATGLLANDKTVVGGLVGALIAVEICKKVAKIANTSGDFITLPLVLGLIIGRFSDLYAGMASGCYGLPTTLIWGMNLGDGIKRHPTSVYEIIFLSLLFIILKSQEKRLDKIMGLKFKIFMGTYLWFRFLVDFLKPDPTIWLGLSIIQLTALIVAAYYVWDLLSRWQAVKAEWTHANNLS